MINSKLILYNEVYAPESYSEYGLRFEYAISNMH
jgi:hypothetical protein